MTIYVDHRSMTSDITPEIAERTTDHARSMWRLSWMPERRLSYEQARAGMELDEIVSDPNSCTTGWPWHVVPPAPTGWAFCGITQSCCCTSRWRHGCPGRPSRQPASPTRGVASGVGVFGADGIGETAVPIGA